MTRIIPLLAELAAWWLAATAFGVAALPLAARLLAPWPARGVAFARPLGLLLGGVLLWFGNAAGLLERGRGSAALALALVGLAGWAAAASAQGRRRLGGFVRQWRAERRIVFAGEALVLVAILAWGGVRSALPAIRHSEQPTDLMLLNAVAEGVGFPPEDPWLAGEPLAYHDLGHWMVFLLARLAGSATAHAFNLAQATWLALLLGAAFGVGSGLAAGSRRPDREASTVPASGWSGTGSGLLAAAAVGLLGNLAAWTAPGSPLVGGDGVQGLWWWAPSRAIVDRDALGNAVEAITEFPAFSYLLGDLHAHLLAMPFWILVAALAFAPWLDNGPSATGERMLRGLTLALASGAFLALDPWQLPGLGLLLVTAAALERSSSSWRERLRAALQGALLWCIGLVPFLALRRSASAQVRGVLPNLANPSSVVELALVGGTLLPAVAVLAVLAWRAARPSRRTLAVALLAPTALVALAIGGLGLCAGVRPAPEWITAPPMAPILAVGAGIVFVLLLDRGLVPGRRVALALAGVGLLLWLAPELAFIHDAFDSRANTVFKLGLQGWALLAVAASQGAVWAWSERHRLAAGVAWAGLALGAGYLPAGLATRLEARPAALSFDALADLPAVAPGELAAIRYLATHAKRGERVLCAPGESFRVASSLVATATGRPTLLGWVGHERQWRGRHWPELEARRTDYIDEMYRSARGERLALILARWRVRWILLGEEERRQFALTPAREAEIAAGLETVVDRFGVRLLRVGGEEP